MVIIFHRYCHVSLFYNLLLLSNSPEEVEKLLEEKHRSMHKVRLIHVYFIFFSQVLPRL